MALRLDPVQPWYLLAVGIAALLALVVLARSLRDRWRIISPLWRYRLAVLATSLCAAGALALAAWNPALERTQASSSVHLVVAVDVSDSVLRIDGGWRSVQARTADFLHKSLSHLSPEMQLNGRASLINFRSSTSAEEVELDDLIDALGRLDESRFAAGEETDIGRGLDRARELLEGSGGRGAILLVTDGNETKGSALAAAEDIARLGMPITVLPLEGGNPELSLTSLNLAGQVEAGEETILRGVVWNRSTGETNLAVRITRNESLDEESFGVFGPSSSATSESRILSSQEYLSIRPPVVFEGGGLQYLDVLLLDESDTVLHRRRLYTSVYKPISLLAVAGDNSWVATVPSDTITVTQIEPRQLETFPDLTRFDAVVISDVLASQFPKDQLERIAVAVEESAIGLFVFNGGHRGANEEAESVLRSYFGTPLDRVLPVSTEPRPDTPEPPPRHVVMIIDSSGSMEGWKLAKAKEIASTIATGLMRPQDTLDVIAFTVGVAHVVDSQLMDATGQQYAVGQIRSLRAGGGTDPTDALRRIAGRQLSNCGLIFISDGEFQDVAIRPDCRATVFAIQEMSIPGSSPLYELADPFVAGRDFSPAGITIPYFEPEKRDKFFERGVYTPLSMAAALSLKDFPPVPALRLEGNAVSYPRPGADLIAVRPKLTDPILVYGKAGEGYVGVFSTELTPEWVNTAEGQAAVQDWLRQVVARADSDRYALQMLDNGKDLHLCIEVRGEEYQVPDISWLSISVDTADDTYPVAMAPDDQAPARFCGMVRVPREDRAQPAQLILIESGPDALVQPQRVPMLIPPEGVVDDIPRSETYSYGVNVALLTQIAKMSGGEFAPEEGAAFFSRSVARRDAVVLWPWLLAFSACLYLLAIGVRRLSR